MGLSQHEARATPVQAITWRTNVGPSPGRVPASPQWGLGSSWRRGAPWPAAVRTRCERGAHTVPGGVSMAFGVALMLLGAALTILATLRHLWVGEAVAVCRPLAAIPALGWARCSLPVAWYWPPI